MKEIKDITKEDLADIQKLATLKYTITQIALMKDICVSEFKKAMLDTGSQVYAAYTAGKLEGQLAYRYNVLSQAKAGQQWAIEMLERWEIAQKEEEFGGQN